ncbi:MAG: GH25 family lysozyme [Hyphomicrobium sp.]
MRNRLIALLAVVALTAIPVFLYPYLELAPHWHSVIGIDVSSHQGEIDWPRVADAGVAFAYIKATEGGDFRDKRFLVNWLGAKSAGIARGAYHFFTACRSGAEQAQNFIATVPREHGVLPPVIDAEHMGPCRERAQLKDLAAEIEVFMDAVERYYGWRPLVYTTADFDDQVLQGRLENEKIWARSMVIAPRYRERQWLIWQYHNHGRRPGITGPVDLNVFRGSAADFARFAGD